MHQMELINSVKLIDMKREITKILSVLTLIIASITVATAQTARSSYFLESSPYRHNLNPAFASEYAYVGMPLLSNVSLDLQSNVGVSNFMFPGEDGDLFSFLNESVSADQFLSGMPSTSRLNSDVGITILGTGFYAFGGFNTVDISLKSNFTASISTELFEFFKVGEQNSTQTVYHMGDISVAASAYIDIAFGHSHKINDKWQVGGKFKVLLGLSSMYANISQLDLTLNEDSWIIESEGEVDMSVPGATFKSESEATSSGEQQVVSGFDFSDISYNGVQGAGAAIDLGVVFNPIKNLSLSASLNDLGFIRWRNNVSAKVLNNYYEYTGAELTTGDKIIVDESDELLALIQLEEVSKPTKTLLTNTSLNIGAEYSFLNNTISLGVLSHTRFTNVVYSETLFVANFRAKRAFMMSLNGALTNMGHSFGALLNVSPKGFNFFLGVECTPSIDIIPDYYMPIDKFSVSFTTGISFTFGERNKYDML